MENTPLTYQRFLKYIDDSSKDIDLPTKFDNITTPYNTTKKDAQLSYASFYYFSAT
ncbi:hypothetical protein LamDB_58160 [Bacillus anthracis]|uniref:Uncharacterized protein n=1 Tax=Bacillus anthracis TaxID=1392 RepID=A0A640N883_BACAN|nr:hypothetical protein BAN44_4662 [Bacillus anthracis]GAO67498.1 hypothetical protein BA5240_4748 [Bacillus anthracis]GET95460.1 hypothetical protein TuanDB_12170 [Bacillus anthracis]GEU00199.1 hypothetical protein DB1_26030 [Bacillus anthracis]GEU04699.1 hypothetical protein HG1_01860 [Bacillus anthracis]